MAFQTPITIKEVIENIHIQKYLLPAIQREFVWDTDQVERLFDSILQGYPVGSFLFWQVQKEKSRDFQFYEFIRNYHEKTNRHNTQADIRGGEEVTAILDGQQRLTSMYIGLKGSYAYKLPRMRRDNPAAYPKQYLYLNLLAASDDYERVYNFKFMTNEQREKDNIAGKAHWFKVGDILHIEEQYEVNNYLIEHDLNTLDKEQAKFANQTLFKLHKAIHDTPSINYYLEKDQQLDKVLNIFIRVNSGGTALSYSDLLLSIATAQWKDKDARKEITEFVEDINQIGSGFNFDKDFVLKASLVLCDFKDIAFKVDNFNSKTMKTIEENWEENKEAITLAVNLISSFGYSQDTLVSNNAVIPIAYYILKKGNPHNISDSTHFMEDRKKINKWLIISLLKRVFSGQPDNVLRPLRKLIESHHSEFPLSQIIVEFKGREKSFSFNDDEIENLLTYRYGQKHTFSILAALYPTLDFKNKFHLDHIYAKSLFTRRRLEQLGVQDSDVDFYLENVNLISNLQLLEGVPNIEKSDQLFEGWLAENYADISVRKDYQSKHYIPDIDLNITNFKEFVIQRKTLMFNELKNVLLVTKHRV